MNHYELARDIGYDTKIIERAKHYENKLFEKASSQHLPINGFVTGLFLACYEYDKDITQKKLRTQFGLGKRTIRNNLDRLKSMGVDTHEF